MDQDLHPKATHKPGDWEPHFKTWTLHYQSGAREIVRATFGVEGSAAAFDHLLQLIKGAHGPEVLERGAVIPLSKTETVAPVAFAYWSTPQTYQLWNNRPDVRAFFESDKTFGKNIARWQESGIIALTHNETNYSHDETLTGIAKLPITQRAPCDIYSYWGAARDRLPASQNDAMAPYGNAKQESISSGVDREVVVAPGNLCVIRTSQDWSKAPKDHENWYLGSVEPTLKAGARFLHQRERTVGALAIRYLQEADDDGNLVGRTCVLGYFDSMASLEEWTHNHPTHKAIYDAGLEMFAAFGTDVGVRLYHEVSVFTQGAFIGEYTNSPSHVGLLRTLSQDARA